MATRDIAAEMAKAKSVAELDKLYKEREQKIASEGITGVQASSELYDQNKARLQIAANEAAGATGVVPTQDTSGSSDMISKLTKAQREATLGALEKARQQGIASLEQEKATIAPQYAQQRSLARQQSRTGARSFQDFMAQRGLARSGGAALGETQRLGALQGSLGALGQQEAAAFGNIAQRRSALEQGYASDVASAEAGLQASALERALAQQESNRQFALQEAGLTGQYGGQQTLAAQGQAFSQNLAAQQFDESVRQFEAQYGLNLRQMDFNEAQAAIDNAIKRGQLSVSQGNLALQRAKFAYDQKQEALANPTQQDILGASNLDNYIRNIGLSADGIVRYLQVPKNKADWESRFGTYAVDALLDQAVGSRFATFEPQVDIQAVSDDVYSRFYNRNTGALDISSARNFLQSAGYSSDIIKQILGS